MKKILLIEDNDLNLKLMKDILEAQGYETDVAKDGQEGLDKALQNDYALILLDIQMPVVSGYDFLKLYNKNTPIVVVSACAMDEEIKNIKELGCSEYITKPIKIKEFLQTVNKYI